MDDHIIRRVSATYDDAELFVLRMIREAVQEGLIDDEAHYRAQHAALKAMQRVMWRYLTQVEQGVYDDVIATLREATHYGHLEAARSIPGTVHVPSVGIEAIALETTTAVTSQHRQILRAAADIYQKIARQTIAGGLVAGAPVETVAQRMLSDLAARGVQTFIDSAGREWGMESYTRMVSRTGAQRAMNEGRRQTFIENGVKLVRASQHRTSHPWCVPYQGRILSLTGESGDVQVQDRVTGEMMTVHVTASLAEAEANGYHHPNCRHVDHAYIPGMPTPEPVEYDPQEYEDLQRQRQLERHLRRWRREKEVALTAARRRQATEKVRVWQAELKRHVDSREYLSRYYERER